MSGFIPKHIEQPASLQSKPASIKILSNPSSSACFLTSVDPGTIIAPIVSETFFPLTTSAASLKSSILPLVQLPIKTLSNWISLIFSPGFKSIYSKALDAASFSDSSLKSSG